MIEKLLKNLPRVEMRALMCAFEQEIAHYIVLDENKFVGVNVQSVPHLKILESSGDWSRGIIK